MLSLKFSNNYFIFIIIFQMFLVSGFHLSSQIIIKSHSKTSIVVMKENKPSPASQLLFKGTEIFGNILKLTDDKPNDSDPTTINLMNSNIKQQKMSLEEIGQRIKTEYENLFWVTGNMDLSLWEDNCTFADPFSSFGGDGSLLRFKSNADNLSKLVENPVSKVTSYEVIKEQILSSTPVDVIKVGWSFSSVLKLPWRPVLAAAGVTSHYVSVSSGKIIKYEEAWKSKPLDVVLRLFVPSRK